MATSFRCPAAASATASVARWCARARILTATSLATTAAPSVPRRPRLHGVTAFTGRGPPYLATAPVQGSSQRCFAVDAMLEGNVDVASASGDLTQITEMLLAARNARMDRALTLAEPLAAAAGKGESPREFVARECSDRAADSFISGREARERAVSLAISGAAFDIPGRGTVRPAHLAEGFWIKDVYDQYVRADAMAKLAKASLALRGVETAEALETLQRRRDQDGDVPASDVLAVAARDLHLIGKMAPLKLQTSRAFSILQQFVARTFTSGVSNIGKYPSLFNLMLKAGRHFNEHLGSVDPKGPLDDPPEQVHDVVQLLRWAEKRQSAASSQLRIITEIVSEASSSLLTDREDALAFVNVAKGFCEADYPLSEKRASLTILRGTEEQLKARYGNS
eukprot:TRINITY_DN29721_c0_g1_i1.p1 TRINITY_DN29721_c0_g1~~TRINITY_DN29721_c0_g1_i1.p1  ORF type:complete len:422 (+),score=79.62 TRINITY_DN29721_c0_g1_i1:80-1267(+)